MEEILLEFGLDILKGVIKDEILSAFDKPIDFKKLLEDFADRIEKVIWDEALEEYSTKINTIIQSCKNDYPNIIDKNKKIDFLTDKMDTLRESINFLLNENMINSGMTHILLGIGLHSFMLLQLNKIDKDSADYIKTIRKYLNDWYPQINQNLLSRRLPNKPSDIDDIKENIEWITKNEVTYSPHTPTNGDMVEFMIWNCPFNEYGGKWYTSCCNSDDRDYCGCQCFEPYKHTKFEGYYHWSEKLRSSNTLEKMSVKYPIRKGIKGTITGLLSADLVEAYHYYNCYEGGDSGIPSAFKQKSLAKKEREKRLVELNGYLTSIEWIAKTVDSWTKIIDNDTWPLLKD